MKPSATTCIGIACALLVGALLAWNDSHPAASAEPLPLRWARTAAQHPLRTGLALALLAWALRPARNYPPDSNSQ
ncbi:MAG: hypothetical protein EXS08_02665 [Planctomycetes bacterium]|nr:hypothetical protein [Planctomycetota bacterium]